MKKLFAFFFAILLAIFGSGCADSQIEQKAQATAQLKPFFERRYTTLGYYEYFSKMRPLQTLKNTRFNEPSLPNSNIQLVKIGGETTLYIAPVSTIRPSEVEALTHIKDFAVVSNREVIYVTTKNEIYCVDHYTGEKHLLHASSVPVSNLSASVNLITYTYEGTLYRIFRPTGQVDRITLPCKSWIKIFNPQLRANLLMTYETCNPAYYKYVYLCAEGTITEECWSALAQDFGEAILEFKNTEDGNPVSENQLESILKNYSVSKNLINVYDMQTGQTYTYDKEQQECPCPYKEICRFYDLAS